VTFSENWDTKKEILIESGNYFTINQLAQFKVTLAFNSSVAKENELKDTVLRRVIPTVALFVEFIEVSVT
jgi:hypothetical protein